MLLFCRFLLVYCHHIVAISKKEIPPPVRPGRASQGGCGGLLQGSAEEELPGLQTVPLAEDLVPVGEDPPRLELGLQLLVGTLGPFQGGAAAGLHQLAQGADQDKGPVFGEQDVLGIVGGPSGLAVGQLLGELGEDSLQGLLPLEGLGDPLLVPAQKVGVGLLPGCLLYTSGFFSYRITYRSNASADQRRPCRGGLAPTDPIRGGTPCWI